MDSGSVFYQSLGNHGTTFYAPLLVRKKRRGPLSESGDEKARIYWQT